MIQLMKSNNNGERFILVGENIENKKLLTYIAKLSKVKSPSIEANKAMISIAWRLDWLLSKILKRKRKLTKITAAAAISNKQFDATKIKSVLHFNFQKKEEYLTTNLVEQDPFV